MGPGLGILCLKLGILGPELGILCLELGILGLESGIYGNSLFFSRPFSNGSLENEGQRLREPHLEGALGIQVNPPKFPSFPEKKLGILGAETAFLGNHGIKSTWNDPSSGFSCSSLVFEGFSLLFPFLGSGIPREFRPRLPGVFGIRFSLENTILNGEKSPQNPQFLLFHGLGRAWLALTAQKFGGAGGFIPKNSSFPGNSGGFEVALKGS